MNHLESPRQVLLIKQTKNPNSKRIVQTTFLKISLYIFIIPDYLSD